MYMFMDDSVRFIPESGFCAGSAASSKVTVGVYECGINIEK